MWLDNEIWMVDQHHCKEYTGTCFVQPETTSPSGMKGFCSKQVESVGQTRCLKRIPALRIQEKPLRDAGVTLIINSGISANVQYTSVRSQWMRRA